MNGTTLLTTPDSFAINGNAATLSTLLVGSGGLFLDGSNLVINRGLNFGNVGSRLILEGDITTTGTSSSQILSLDGNNFGTSDISLSSVAGNFTRTITTGNGANLTIALPITNGNATAAGILKNGAGTLILSGTNTYTGATTISAGTLSIASVNNLSSTSGISIGDTGVLAYTGAAATLNRTISVTSGNGTVRNTGSGLLTLSGTLTKNGTTLRLSGGSGGIAVSGAIVGSNANSDLLIDGGSVTLASANSYNGPTAIINGGTLTASVVNALPTANGRSAISIDATGTGGSALALAASQSIASLSGASSSNVTLGSNTLTVGTTSGSTTFAGRISGTGGLIKDGASTLVLTGSNTYTGNTTVAGGTLQAASAGALANSSVVNVSSGSLLVTAGNSVNNNAAINLGGGTLALSGTFNETVGILTLSANSVINLDGFTGTLRFDGVGDWAPTANLAIWNWNGINQYGTPVGNGANNRHVVFTNNSGLSNYLDRISFYSDSGSSFAGNSFEVGFAGGGTEIIAVPEPETYLTIIFMLSVLGIYKLRSLKRKLASVG
jgi:autotransporter-associated beta strand protein